MKYITKALEGSRAKEKAFAQIKEIGKLYMNIDLSKEKPTKAQTMMLEILMADVRIAMLDYPEIKEQQEKYLRLGIWEYCKKADTWPDDEYATYEFYTGAITKIMDEMWKESYEKCEADQPFADAQDFHNIMQDYRERENARLKKIAEEVAEELFEEVSEPQKITKNNIREQIGFYYAEKAKKEGQKERTFFSEELAKFIAEPGHEFFEEVREEMVKILREAEKELTLQEAYDIACEKKGLK